ncbi:MAG: iron-containing alcohol dehydrogenase [Promethearchaeota archaeon]|nr:MAG: iron-containing alcohol dehydrogenase [Candidatus Lokiarchaeota archaeon]
MWFFYSPNIIYGEDSLNFLENISGNRCFVVTDKGIEDTGLLRILTEKLDKYQRSYTIFNEIVPDPHEEDVMKGKEECIKYAPDLIIAIGGGSVIDTAKAIWCLYEFPKYTIDNIQVNSIELFEMGKKAKLIAITTNSGTGAETTNVAVISRYETNVWRKIFCMNKGLVPTYAIVDPIFTKNLPPKLTSSSAFDALAHSVECLVSLWGNEFSNAMALKAIELIFKYLPIVYKDGTNKEARDMMHQAASIAGLAFGNAQIMLAHTLGHTFGSLFHVPHGEACGISLPYAVQYILNDPSGTSEAVKIYGKLAKQLGWAKWDEDDKKAAYKVVDKIKELQKEINFPSSLKETGVSQKDFEDNFNTLIMLCFQEATSVLVPRIPNKAEFEKLFTYTYEGKDVDF